MMMVMTAKVARLRTRLAAKAHRLASEASGTTAVEYGVLITFIGIVVAASTSEFGSFMTGILESLAEIFRG